MYIVLEIKKLLNIRLYLRYFHSKVILIKMRRVDFNEEDEFIFEVENFNKLDQSTNILHPAVDEPKVNPLKLGKDFIILFVKEFKK